MSDSDWDSALYDVIVVGAGPAGCYLAYLTASAGLKTLVLEEHAEPGLPCHCAGIVGADYLKELGVYGSDKPSFRFTRLTSYRLFAPSGLSSALPWPECFQIDRVAHDGWLAALACRNGAHICFSRQVLAVDAQCSCRLPGWSGKCAQVISADASGRRTSSFARCVVLAGGTLCTLSRKIRQAATDDFDYTAQCRISLSLQDVCPAHPLAQVNLLINPEFGRGGFAYGVFPELGGSASPIGADGRVAGLLGLVCRREPDKCFAGLRSFFIKNYPRTVPVGQVAYRIIPRNAVSRSVQDRCVLLGDAAGQCKTTTGGGLLYCRRCAAVLAGVLTKCLDCPAGQEDLSVLQEYERTWRGLLEKEQFFGRKLRSILDRLDQGQRERLYSLLLSPGSMEIWRHSLGELESRGEVSFDRHFPLVRGLLDSLRPTERGRLVSLLGTLF